MGWKTFKNQFGINHIVQRTKEGILIGSSYVGRLAIVSEETGEIKHNVAFPQFIKETYPSLHNATKEEILLSLNTSDVFSTSILVYTYEEDMILEKYCEELGYPNITHDGCLMYVNKYSTSKSKIVKIAKQQAQLHVEYSQEGVNEAHQELLKRTALLTKDKDILSKLNQSFPGITVDS